MGNQSSAKLSKTVVVASARMAVPAGCVLAWVFVVFLSAALYQGNQSVGSATLSTVFCSLCFFGTLAVVLALFGMQRLVERKRELYAIGAVLIIAASVLPVLPFFSGLHGWFAPMIVGCLSGAGLALISLFFIAFVAGMAFAAAVVWYLLSLAIGIGLYLLYMVVASGGFANSILSRLYRPVWFSCCFAGGRGSLLCSALMLVLLPAVSYVECSTIGLSRFLP